MRTLRFIALAAGLILGVVALAATNAERGWSEGTPGANAARVLSGLPGDRTLTVPESLAPQLGDSTLLVYFSPRCPHCQRAQPSFNALAERLEGQLKVVGIASGSATEGQVAGYRIEYEVPYPIVLDTDRAIAAAMGVRSTPSALMVKKKGDETVIVDGWYPYLPGQDALIEMHVLEDPWKAFRPGVYVGNGACAACHSQEMDSWQITHHSIAWHALVEDGEHRNPECTGCHVTGAGQPGGWDGDGESPLVDVGCEACHGPGGPHDGEATDASTVCVGCHDPKHSIAFSYEKGLPLLDHFKAATLDDEGWYEARKALLDGTADKALLAFPEGATAGAGACRECHEAEHAAWAASPHAKAMATLATDEAKAHSEHAATEVACVSCHATAREIGVPPSSLEGYRADEGVGCESCHGPGERHVKAQGGTDNIQALGDDCPVCVLEAVCTRCHTKEWDPGWDLDAKLSQIQHGNR